MTIIRCASCDGFGWFEDETGVGVDCDWCAGAGYVYRDEAGRDLPIPQEAYPQVAAELEALEEERLRELGYQGGAKKPWQQQIRRGTQLGRDPYAGDKQ